MNTLTINQTNQPLRTVKAVQAISTKLERYDRLYEQAVIDGDLRKAAQYQDTLYMLDSQIARVSDNLWTKFCNQDTVKALKGEL